MTFTWTRTAQGRIRSTCNRCSEVITTAARDERTVHRAQRAHPDDCTSRTHGGTR